MTISLSFLLNNYFFWLSNQQPSHGLHFAILAQCLHFFSEGLLYVQLEDPMYGGLLTEVVGIFPASFDKLSVLF